MFLRGNSGNWKGKVGKYSLIIDELHKKGVYHSKQILLELLQYYIDGSNKLLKDGSDFQSHYLYGELVEKFKNNIELLDNEFFIIPLIKWFNSHHLTLNYKDDIFYLLSAYFSCYEVSLPKMNLRFKSQIIIQDKWRYYLVKSNHSILNLTDVFFELTRDYQNCADFIIKVVNLQQTLFPAKHGQEFLAKFDLHVKNKHALKPVAFYPSQAERIKRKIKILSPVLSQKTLIRGAQYLLDLDEARRKIDQQQYDRAMVLIDDVSPFIKSFTSLDLQKLVRIVMQLAENHRITFVCQWLQRNDKFIDPIYLYIIHDKLIELFAKAAPSEKMEIVSLVDVKKIQNSDFNQSVFIFITSFLNKKNFPDSTNFILAANYFFSLFSKKNLSLRIEVIEVLLDFLSHPGSPINKAEIILLLLEEYKLVDQALITEVINELSTFNKNMDLDYLGNLCEYLNLLKPFISALKRKQIIINQIELLEENNLFSESSALVLMKLASFIRKEHHELIINQIKKILMNGLLFNNTRFLLFFRTMLGLMPQYEEELAILIYSYYVKKPCIEAFNFLIACQLVCYLNPLDRFNLALSGSRLICEGSLTHDYFEQHKEVMEACFNFEGVIHFLSLDQKIWFLSLLSTDIQQENHLAGLLFFTVFADYKNELIKNLVSCVKAESGRRLPPELIEHIVEMSNSL